MHYHTDLSYINDRRREIEAEADYQRLANGFMRHNRQARYRKIKHKTSIIIQYILAMMPKFERKVMQPSPQIDLNHDCCTCV